MALEEKKGQLGGSGAPKTPREKMPEPKTEPSKPPSFVRKEDFMRRMKSESGGLQAKTGMYGEQREKMAKQIFGNLEYGLKDKKLNETLKKLQQKRSYVKTDAEGRDLDRQIKIAKAAKGFFQNK